LFYEHVHHFLKKFRWQITGLGRRMMFAENQVAALLTPAIRATGKRFGVGRGNATGG